MPRKLKLTDTFHDFYQRAVSTRSQIGQMSRAQVVTLQVLFAREAGVCEKCESTEDLTADHVVPAVLLKILGYDVDHEFRIEWYQALCRKCNQAKAASIDWDSYRTTFILNKAMRERPRWVYWKTQNENSKILKGFEILRDKIEAPRGPKRLTYVDGKPVWVERLQTA